jgi:uncharacterized protein (DUF433 family)
MFVAHESVEHRDRIVRAPDVMAGTPVVKGTRIAVELVLARLAATPTSRS